MAQNTILLDKNKLEGMNGRFAAVLDKTVEAAQLAEKAEKLQQDAGMCSAVANSTIKFSEDIRSIIKLIVESFSTTDEKNKKQAESIVGVEIHHAISSNGLVHVNPDGTYSVDYSPRLAGYEGIPQYSDECTNISCAMMLQRWMIAHDPNYNNEYGYRGTGQKDIHPYVDPWAKTTSVDLGDGHTFKTEFLNNGTSSSGMADLLSTHPEGVVIWGPYKDHKHAIIVTRCEQREDGSYQFYAIDPSNVKYAGQKTEIPLESTHLYKNWNRYSNSDQLFNQSVCQYVTSGTY